MTTEEFSKLRFELVSHVVTKDEHTTIYSNEDYRIALCIHTTYSKHGEVVYGRTEWMLNGKTYKTGQSFAEAIKKIRSTRPRTTQSTLTDNKQP